MLSLKEFNENKLRSIVGVLGGRVISKDTAQGASSPKAYDTADATPSERKWDNTKWYTAEDPGFEDLSYP